MDGRYGFFDMYMYILFNCLFVLIYHFNIRFLAKILALAQKIARGYIKLVKVRLIFYRCETFSMDKLDYSICKIKKEFGLIR